MKKKYTKWFMALALGFMISAAGIISGLGENTPLTGDDGIQICFDLKDQHFF